MVVTAGCNQAFCLVADALAEAGRRGDPPLPYYFNHDMWLRINGIVPVYLEPDARPDADGRGGGGADLAADSGDRRWYRRATRPGSTVRPARDRRIRRGRSRHDIALILDETYRSFRDTGGTGPCLSQIRSGTATLVSLHSFSKDLAIPGYRVGAVVAVGRS